MAFDKHDQLHLIFQMVYKTKSNMAKKLDVSRPTLNKILKDDQWSLDTHARVLQHARENGMPLRSMKLRKLMRL